MNVSSSSSSSSSSRDQKNNNISKGSRSPRKTNKSNISSASSVLASISKDIDDLDGALSTVFEVEDEDNMDKTGAIVKIKQSGATVLPRNQPIPTTQSYKTNKAISSNHIVRDSLDVDVLAVKPGDVRVSPRHDSGMNNLLTEYNDYDDDDQNDQQYDIIEDSLEDDEYYELEEALSRKIDSSLFDIHHNHDHDDDSNDVDVDVDVDSGNMMQRSNPAKGKISTTTNSRERKVMEIEARRSNNNSASTSNNARVGPAAANGNGSGNGMNPTTNSIGGVPSRYAAKLAGLENLAPIPKPTARHLMSAPPSTNASSPDSNHNTAHTLAQQHPKSSIAYHRTGASRHMDDDKEANDRQSNRDLSYLDDDDNNNNDDAVDVADSIEFATRPDKTKGHSEITKQTHKKIG